MLIFISLSAKIKSKYGYVSYNWKRDLEEEEEPGYIPKGYDNNKILELSMIEVDEPGKGHGVALMHKFLECPDAKKAELIMLDPVPFMGSFFDSNLSEEQQVKKLQEFYRQFGFRNKPNHARMWLVRKGTIPTSKLPT